LIKYLDHWGDKENPKKALNATGNRHENITEIGYIDCLLFSFEKLFFANGQGLEKSLLAATPTHLQIPTH
jgi:hypothetical protein